MSGGSFDYLCNKEFEHFVSYQVDPEIVESMAGELEALGYETLAEATRTVMREAVEIRGRYEKRFQVLAAAWRAVEWWRSNDSSKEAALLACAEATAKLGSEKALLDATAGPLEEMTAIAEGYRQRWDLAHRLACSNPSYREELRRLELLLQGLAVPPLQEYPARWEDALAPDTRSPECVAIWPACESGAYHPNCCRFPKSCSC